MGTVENNMYSKSIVYATLLVLSGVNSQRQIQAQIDSIIQRLDTIERSLNIQTGYYTQPATFAPETETPNSVSLTESSLGPERCGNRWNEDRAYSAQYLKSDNKRMVNVDWSGNSFTRSAYKQEAFAKL